MSINEDLKLFKNPWMKIDTIQKYDESIDDKS